MSKLTRIEFIRKSLAVLGGKVTTYYADGPRSSLGGKSHPSHVHYKIEKFWDHMSPESRVQFATAMNKDEILDSDAAVELGYIRTYINRGGHIVVVFNGAASTIKKQPKTFKITLDFLPKKQDNVPTVTTAKTPMMTKDEELKSFLKNFGSDQVASIMAKNAIEAMTESAVMMCEDDHHVPIPDMNGICEMASDYMFDMFNDFRESVIKEINKLGKTAKLNDETTREVKLSVKFD